MNRSLVAGHVLLTGLAGLVALTGCRSTPPDPRELDAEDYPGVLREAGTLGIDLMCRQRVTASWGEERSRSFEAVLQKQSDELVLLGLSPLGQVGFVLKLHDGEVSFENRTEVELPFPARFILLDVQRAFYPWLAEGRLDGVVDGERVVERRDEGRLVERSFARVDERPPGRIVVRYEAYEDGRVIPGRVEIDNGWFGYCLTVETFEEQLLPEH